MIEPLLKAQLKDGTILDMYTPSEKQKEFHLNPTKNLVAIGNRGGGKSLMLRFDAHVRALSCPGANLVLIRKTYRDLLKTHILFQANPRMPWGSLKQEMELLGGDFNKTDYVCLYPNGSKLFLSYVGHESDAMNLLGAEFLAAYFDELSTIPWEFFTRLSASVRVPANSGWNAVIRGATNPLGESTPEIMKYFVNKDVDFFEDPDYDPSLWGSIRINMQDNPNIDSAQYLKQLISLNLPEHIKRAWIDGEYFEESALFSFYPQKDGKPYHIIPELDLEAIIQKARIYRVYDHGYKPDPAYCAWIAHLGNRYIVFHEKIWYETVVKDIAESIKTEDTNLGLRDSKDSLIRPIITYCDPTIDIKTGQDYRTIKDLFEESGIPMDCSINNRTQFAGAIHTALAEEVILKDGETVPKLQIYCYGNKIGCPYLAKSIPMMRYSQNHPLALADHKHDHSVVALAYFLISISSYDSKEVKKSTIRPWMKPSNDELWVLGKNNSRR